MEFICKCYKLYKDITQSRQYKFGRKTAWTYEWIQKEEENVWFSPNIFINDFRRLISKEMEQR